MRENLEKRGSGLPLIGDLPWGSSFALFYETENDLIEILVPYLAAGLEHNECCAWLISKPLTPEIVKASLAKAIPGLGTCEQKGQIEIAVESCCDEAAGDRTAARAAKAASKGFAGLRFACTFEASGPTTPRFLPDESAPHNTISAAAYPRGDFDALRLMEMVKSYDFALLRNNGKWEIIESSEARVSKDTLNKNEAKLRSIFRHMSEGFAYHRIVLDKKGLPCDYVFLEVNEAFEKLTGLKSENITGKKVTEALPGIEKDPADLIRKYGEVALTGKPFNFDSYVEALDKWYAISAFSSKKNYFAVTFTDITERKRAEEQSKRSSVAALNLLEDAVEARRQSEQSAENLKRSNEDLEQFAYVASHDLQEPLRVMSSYSQLLEKRYKDKLDNDARDFINFIVEAANRMQGLINDLLAYSRANRLQTPDTEVDCDQVLKELTKAMDPTVKSVRGRIVFEKLPVVWARESAIMQLFQNLIGNALKFRSEEPPVINISVAREKNEWVFSVKDNGIGIEPQYRERIFQIFQRLHTRDKYPGTGIGLSICKKIIENIGGRLWVESDYGKGSTFYFTIPMKS
jgi:PAS domain S-box-containing protein